MAKKLLMRHFLDLYYASTESVFIATEEEVKELEGAPLDFGECAGKHSEVSEPLLWRDIEVISDSQELISVMEHHLGDLISGPNVLQMAREALKGDEL